VSLSALDDATVWLNSPPLTAQTLRGRVVVADVCTYSCINWLRTLPYVRAWAQRYADDGLVVVGVHAPEFGFEHDVDNVRRALGELDVPYPVVLDNDFAIWRSLDNQYWPAVYVHDRGGRVVFRHFGEGRYAETEQAIQAALGVRGDVAQVDATGLFAPADWDGVRTPETYVGRARGDGGVELSGGWSVEAESAVLQAAGGSLRFRFEARDLNLVLTPPDAGPVAFQVRLDGRPPQDDHGLDIDPSGAGTVDQPRMYQLVRQAAGAAQRSFEISFDAAGVRAYVLTFG
jgi:thiol-disulfide isomerase/thioredoxin